MNKCWNVLFVVVSCMQVYIILLTVISEDEILIQFVQQNRDAKTEHYG